jgi:hypothetical protein
MRLLSAALLGAAASLPAFVRASAPSDPAEAAATVPAITVPSVFDGYRPYRDSDNPTWQELNQAVRNKPAVSGMGHGGGDKPPGNSHPDHSKRGAATP